MNYIFAPGCALTCHNGELEKLVKAEVEKVYGQMPTLSNCCFNRPHVEAGVTIITPCTTCHQRYTKLYPDNEVIFLLDEWRKWDEWEFPNYKGMEMSIQDTCSARSDEGYLNAIRTMLKKMNIALVEPRFSGKKSKCCGQIMYDKLPLEKVENYMQARAEEMPKEEVVVYCASCIQAMRMGKKEPRYILDLLFERPTLSATKGVKEWNDALKEKRERGMS